MTVLISMLIGTFLLHTMFLQIRESNELTRTEFRFRYFALRDRLAMLVAAGRLKEDSWEYQHIVDTLNFHISAVERLSIFRIADVLANYHLSSKEESQVKSFSKRIEDIEVAKIVVGYMETTQDLIKLNSRVQLAFVRAIGQRVRKATPAQSRVGCTTNQALSAIKAHQNALEAKLSIA